MTLSVYHRIEMGQREVSDKEFKNIAKAINMAPEELKEQIKALEDKGMLEEIIQRNDAKYKLLSTPRGAISAFGNSNQDAVNLCTRRLGSLLPTRSILFVDPQDVVSVGDIAVYYSNEKEAKIVSIREDENGQLYGLRWNPDERIEISNDDLNSLHKVVAIYL